MLNLLNEWISRWERGTDGTHIALHGDYPKAAKYGNWRLYFDRGDGVRAITYSKDIGIRVALWKWYKKNGYVTAIDKLTGNKHRIYMRSGIKIEDFISNLAPNFVLNDRRMIQDMNHRHQIDYYGIFRTDAREQRIRRQLIDDDHPEPIDVLERSEDEEEQPRRRRPVQDRWNLW